MVAPHIIINGHNKHHRRGVSLSSLSSSLTLTKSKLSSSHSSCTTTTTSWALLFCRAGQTFLLLAMILSMMLFAPILPSVGTTSKGGGRLVWCAAVEFDCLHRSLRFVTSVVRASTSNWNLNLNLARQGETSLSASPSAAAVNSVNASSSSLLKLSSISSSTSSSTYLRHSPSLGSVARPQALTTTKSTTTSAATRSEKLKQQDGPPLDLCQELPEWLFDLSPSTENQIYSQFGEDGVTEYLIQHVPMGKSSSKQYIEIGTENGYQCNTRILREIHQWTGLLLDDTHHNDTINLQKETVIPETIVSVLQDKYHFYPHDDTIGYFSEDTDYADFYIWQAILEAGYRPRILVSEFNSNFAPNESVTVIPNPPHQVRRWTVDDDYFGMSALALQRLWNRHGYLMVYCTKRKINCFAVRADLILSPDVWRSIMTMTSSSSSTTLSSTSKDSRMTKQLEMPDIHSPLSPTSLKTIHHLQTCLQSHRKILGKRRYIHKCSQASHTDKFLQVDETGLLVANQYVLPASIAQKPCPKYETT